MDFELESNSNFTSLLQQGTQMPMEIGDFEKVHAAKEMSLAEKRGKNFDEHEDKLLVSAWLNTSLDPINGNNMKGDRFWERVEHYYIDGKNKDWQKRSRSSLSHRWGVIQRLVNKFCGCLTQVENRQRSGASNEDNIQEARRLYSAITKGPFRLDHCWDLLKDEEKWRRRDKPSGSKRNFHESSGNETPEVVTLDENDGPSGNERPIGRKGAKQQKRLGTDVLTNISGFTSVLSELKDEKMKLHAEKVEKLNLANEKKSEFLAIKKSQVMQAEEANKIQIEKLKLEQDREDASIMMKDLNSMDPEQRVYFQMRRSEIIARKYGKF